METSRRVTADSTAGWIKLEVSFELKDMAI
jgi:hypothetical protein